MYDLYAWNTPNGQKIVIALEEASADYHYHPIDIVNGEQHTEGFRSLSPDGKIPALVHHSAHEVRLFESGAILLYLAQQCPSLNAGSATDQAQVMSWVFWQVGQLGPLAGQFGRFQNASPANPSAVVHFEQLVWRCLKVMEHRLSASEFLVGDQFTIADIACFPWVASEQSYLQRYDLDWQTTCPAIARWAATLHQRASIKTALSL